MVLRVVMRGELFAEGCFGYHPVLDNVGATVTVQRRVLVPRYAATVTLSAFAANQAFAWMDVRGRMAVCRLMRCWQGWSAFEDKAAECGEAVVGVQLFRMRADRAVFIDVSEVTKTLMATYQFSGELMANAPPRMGGLMWDFLGIDYKAAYNRYLEVSGLGDCRSGQTCSSVSAVWDFGGDDVVAGGVCGCGWA